MPVDSSNEPSSVQLTETASSALAVHRALLLVLAIWFISAVNGARDQGGQHHIAAIEAKSLQRRLFFLPSTRLSDIRKELLKARVGQEMQQFFQSDGPSTRIKLEPVAAMSGIEQLQDNSYKNVLDWTVNFLKAYPQAAVWTTIFSDAAFVDREAFVSAAKKCPSPAFVRLTLPAGDPRQRDQSVLIAGEVAADAVPSVSCGKFAIKAKQAAQWPEMTFNPLIENQDYSLMRLPLPDLTSLSQRERLFPYLSTVWSEIKDKSPREASAYLDGKVLAEDKESDLFGFKLRESYISQVAPVLVSALLFYLFTHIWIIYRAPTGLAQIGRGPYFGLGINFFGWCLLALSLIVCPLIMLNIDFPTAADPHFHLSPSYLFSVIVGAVGLGCVVFTILVAFKAKQVEREDESSKPQPSLARA
jgi:hypothetical protein